MSEYFKHIIFDFDGTLANTMPVVIDIAETMLGDRISDKDIARYRNMTVKQVLKEAKVPLYKVPGLLVKGRPLLQKRMHEVVVFTGLEDVVRDLAKNDYELYVVSSNSATIINNFLSDKKLKSYFKKVYGNVGIFSKAQALKKVVRRQGFSLSEAIYIGDEVRDIEAAKKIGMPIISVTWGYNGKQILESHQPNYVADKPAEIFTIIHG